jgi:cytochrome c5
MNRLVQINYRAVLIVASLSLGACASAAPDKALAANDATICVEPRSQACTRDYRPVCAALEDGSEKTYSNGCTACADASVTAWVGGPCGELN